MSTITNSNLRATYGGKQDGVDNFSAAMWDNLLSDTDSKFNSIIYAMQGVSGNEDGLWISTDGADAVKVTPVSGKVELEHQHTYVIYGSASAEIVIGNAESEPIDDTYVILKGVALTSNSADGCCIKYISTAQSLFVTLASDKANALTSISTADTAVQGACLYSENNMVVQGNGYLSCKNTKGHGIKASKLRLSGRPHIFVDANHDGVHGNSLLTIDGGVYCIKNANDAFGTGDSTDVNECQINVWGGKFYCYGIKQKVFDNKGADGTGVSKTGHIYTTNYSICTDSLPTNIYSGMDTGMVSGTVRPVFDPKVYFGGAVWNADTKVYTTEPTGSVKCYSDIDNTLDETELTAVNGVYTATSAFVKVTGYVEGKIVFPNTKSILSGPEGGYLNISRAYINGSVEYLYDKKKLKITAAKDTVNMVVASDGNAATSTNNIIVEAKAGSHLYMSAPEGAALEGSSITLYDSKGVFIVTGSLVGAIGSEFFVATDDASVTTKGIDGAVMFTGNETDIYARLSGKHIKGNVTVLDAQLRGVFQADSLYADGIANVAAVNAFFLHAKGCVIGKPSVEGDEYIEL